MNWIDDYVRSLGKPNRLNLWSAISIVAAVLQRKVFMRTSMGEAFPNLFVVFVAPQLRDIESAISRTAELVAGLGDGYFVATGRLTSKSLDERMIEAECQADGVSLGYNSLFVCATNLRIIQLERTSGQLNILWDCYQSFRWYFGTADKGTIPRPQVNLLAGSTRGYFSSLRKMDDAFCARCIVINAEGERIPETDFFEDKAAESSRLLENLNEISLLRGQFDLKPEFKRAFVDWQKERDPNFGVGHWKLIFLKLCMIAAASEATLECNERHVDRARSWLLELGMS